MASEIVNREKKIEKFLTFYKHLGKSELVARAKKDNLYEDYISEDNVYKSLLKFAANKKINLRPRKENPVKPLSTFKKTEPKKEEPKPTVEKPFTVQKTQKRPAKKSEESKPAGTLEENLNKTHLSKKKKAKILKCFEDTAEEYNVSIKDLLGKGRKNHLVQARVGPMLMMREKLKMSYGQIGVVFNRNHATILHFISNFKKTDKAPTLDKNLQAYKDHKESKIKDIEVVDPKEIDSKPTSNLEEMEKLVEQHEDELGSRFNRDDFEEEDQEFMLKVWSEKDILISQASLILERIEKLNAFVETYIKYY